MNSFEKRLKITLQNDAVIVYDLSVVYFICISGIKSSNCGQRIDMAPYLIRELKYGEFASSVLAISWGKGDPHKDPITLVFVDEAGRMREHTKIDNLYDADNIDEFKDLLKRRKPDITAVGGFTVATVKLMNRVKELFRGPSAPAPAEGWSNPGDQGWGASNEQAFDIPAIYVYDDVARIYQHSKRATEEFSTLPPNAKYCVGLARYVQSPLNEFAALGPDLTAISLDEDNQHLVHILIYYLLSLFNDVTIQIPKDKLLTAFEEVLVDIASKVGVDINRAVADPYYQHLLPFICGLGPRKAQVLVKKITSQVCGYIVYW